MPGTFVLKPIEANITHNTEFLGRMSPYCAFLLGHNKVKGQVCHKGGKHPHWNDAFTVPENMQSSQLVLEVLDKDMFLDDKIGTCMIDLSEVQAQGHVSKWYALSHHNKPAGEILLESFFKPDPSLISQTPSFQGEQIGMTQPASGQTLQGQQTGMAQTSSTQVLQNEHLLMAQPLPTQAMQTEQLTMAQPHPNQTLQNEQIAMNQHSSFHREGIVDQTSSFHSGAHMYTEQRQVVEPHTFMRNVEVTETRPVQKQIEVMEPHKVLREVQYTEAVPVMRQIEVTEPQVVRKQVEVIEPRVVTKQIQVIENVPVTKQVEVIENRTTLKNVETFEPQTFTRQMEVTEQVPVHKQVTVTEPYTVTKQVEFVEPIITTKTITKEVMEPVIVDERITTTVGPATLIGIETEVREQRFVDQFSQVRLSEQERRLEQEMRYGQETRFEQERRLEQEKLLEQERRLQQGLVGNQTGGYSTSNVQTTQEKWIEGKPMSQITNPYTNGNKKW